MGTAVEKIICFLADCIPQNSWKTHCDKVTIFNKLKSDLESLESKLSARRNTVLSHVQTIIPRVLCYHADVLVNLMTVKFVCCILCSNSPTGFGCAEDLQTKKINYTLINQSYIILIVFRNRTKNEKDYHRKKNCRCPTDRRIKILFNCSRDARGLTSKANSFYAKTSSTLLVTVRCHLLLTFFWQIFQLQSVSISCMVMWPK